MITNVKSKAILSKAQTFAIAFNISFYLLLHRVRERNGENNVIPIL